MFIWQGNLSIKTNLENTKLFWMTFRLMKSNKIKR